MIVADTSVFIELLRGGPRAKQVLNTVGDTILAVSVITLHELLAGDPLAEQKLRCSRSFPNSIWECSL